MPILQLILALLPLGLCSPLGQYRLSSTLAEPCTSGPNHDAAPLVPLKIAIIGTGIVGASAAYTLAENARQNSRAPPISITIFEQNAIVGGRITTTRVFDQDELAIDTCAATFNNALDTCVLQLASDTGLTANPAAVLDNGTAIWNGEEPVGYIEDTGFRDLDLASNFKRARYQLYYGLAPFQSGRMTTQLSYSSLGISRFTSLYGEVSRSGLNESLIRGACEGSDEVLCLDGDIQSEAYLRALVEAGVRDRFFGDYDELNELNAVLGLASENTLSSVSGGNLRLIDRLIKISNAELKLNTKVRSLKNGGSGKWRLASIAVGSKDTNSEEFDRVIIAAPLSLTDLEDFPGSLQLPRLDFADTVVTHFTTRLNLNPTFFGTGLPMPQTILTSATTATDFDRTKVPFFSLRLLDDAIQPVNFTGDPNDFQRLYKIVSSTNISIAEITQYLEPEDSKQPAITWMHREYLPRSVPRLDRTIKIQDELEVRPGLFYAGGGAQVTDTVEFGCRMGTNAANLIVDRPLRAEPGNG